MNEKYCPRCGKAKHKGPCVFDKAKKSAVETLTDDVKTNKDDLTAVKAKVK